MWGQLSCSFALRAGSSVPLSAGSVLLYLSGRGPSPVFTSPDINDDLSRSPTLMISAPAFLTTTGGGGWEIRENIFLSPTLPYGK